MSQYIINITPARPKLSKSKTKNFYTGCSTKQQKNTLIYKYAGYTLRDP